MDIEGSGTGAEENAFSPDGGIDVDGMDVDTGFTSTPCTDTPVNADDTLISLPDGRTLPISEVRACMLPH